MGFNLLTWYCRPMEFGVWAHETGSAFVAYTPCTIDSFVICVSNLVLLVLCLYQIWLITRDVKVQRFRLRSNVYNYMLGFIATYCTVEPLFRLGTGVSIFNLDDQTDFAPFVVHFFSHISCKLYPFIVVVHSPMFLHESSTFALGTKLLLLQVVSLIINALSWGFMLLMIAVETKIYVRAFRWYIRFGFIYLLVADAVMLTFVISLKSYYTRYQDYGVDGGAATKSLGTKFDTITKRFTTHTGLQVPNFELLQPSTLRLWEGFSSS